MAGSKIHHARLRTGSSSACATPTSISASSSTYPHIDGLKEGTCIDIHAKLMIVDDELLRIGSANLCNRSLGLDSECDAAIEAGGNPAVATAIRQLRNRLLGEHLDLPPERIEQEFQHQGSLHGAIETLAGGRRTLKSFERQPEWPKAVLDLARLADPSGPLTDATVIESAAPTGAADWRQGARRLLLALLLLAALSGIWRFTPLADYLRPERVMAWVQAFADRPWAPLAIIAAYTPACLVLFPRPLITLAAIVAFGPLTGTAYGLCGMLLAAFLSYVAGRKLPRHTVRHSPGAASTAWRKRCAGTVS